MTHYHFDWHGSYIGYVDPAGRYFTSTGRCVGNVVGLELYDLLGMYRGRIDTMGNFYNELGRCLGYLRPSHSTRAAPLGQSPV